MRRNDAIKLLFQILKDENLKLHESCWNEIQKLVFGTGQEALFLKKLAHRIDRLNSDGFKAIGSEGLEKLGHATNLYSMHVDTQTLNIRILFAFGIGNIQLLLLAFHEKEGKRKTDYSQKIPIAQQRLKEFNTI